ncbi:MAG TPA: NAD(+) diphosphatase [Gammaproteobacteria bacterium]|nr:NAD(+) diphosphatase [Gammaproteobacteria bacterium]
MNMAFTATFDRLTERRRDAAWLEAALAAPDTCFLPLTPAGHPIENTPHGWRAVLLDAARAQPHLARGAPVILLGEWHGMPCFALETADVGAPALADLRRAAALLPAEEAGLLACARALVDWHARQRHCGRCGAPTVSGAAGHQRACTAASCGEIVFPRIDPAVIVLVEDGTRCLLGRQAQWEAGRYSTLAGFVEPGETLEQAVAREVREEAGIEVTQVRYSGSQPWPFPASLMLGFRARALTRQVTLKDGELAQARWFTRTDIARGLADGTLRLSPPYSIAWHLIAGWYDEEATTPLAASLPPGT